MKSAELTNEFFLRQVPNLAELDEVGLGILAMVPVEGAEEVVHWFVHMPLGRVGYALLLPEFPDQHGPYQPRVIKPDPYLPWTQDQVSFNRAWHYATNDRRAYLLAALVRELHP